MAYRESARKEDEPVFVVAGQSWGNIVGTLIWIAFFIPFTVIFAMTPAWPFALASVAFMMVGCWSLADQLRRKPGFSLSVGHRLIGRTSWSFETKKMPVVNLARVSDEVEWYVHEITSLHIGAAPTASSDDERQQQPAIVVVGPQGHEFLLPESLLGRHFDRTYAALRELIPERTHVVDETDDEPELAEVEVASESTTSPSG